jgi:tight adherence protein B
MVLLFSASMAILGGTFSLVLFMTRRTTRDKSMDQRMEAIHAAGSYLVAVTASPLLLKVKTTGRLGWLEAILQHYKFWQLIQITITQADSSATVSMLVILSLGISLLTFGAMWLFAPVLPVELPAAIFLGFIPYWILRIKRSKRVNAFNAVLADTIDMLARSLRAGYSMGGAIGMVAENAPEPARTEFGEVFRQQNLGLPLRDALLQLLNRYPSLDLRVLITALLVQKDTGGNLVEILERTVAVIRDRLRIQGEIRTQTAQGRLTGWILSALPVIMLILINLINPGYSRILLTDPVGRKLIYISVCLLITGTFIINKIVTGIEV